MIHSIPFAFDLISHLWTIRIIEFLIVKNVKNSWDILVQKEFLNHFFFFISRISKTWDHRPPFCSSFCTFRREEKKKIDRNPKSWYLFPWNLAQQRGKRIVDSRGEECFHYTGDVLYSKSYMTHHARSRMEDVIHRWKARCETSSINVGVKKKKKKIQRPRVIAAAIPLP